MSSQDYRECSADESFNERERERERETKTDTKKRKEGIRVVC